MILPEYNKMPQVHRDIDFVHLSFWVLQRRYLGSNLETTEL